MKVLEIISSLDPTGGAETFAVNFSRELQEISDFKTVVLFQKHKSYFEEKLKEKGIDVVFLNKTKHLDFKNAKELRQIINDFKPDVIHTENNALIPTYLALRKIKKNQRPKVFHTMHLKAEDETSNKIVRFLYKFIFKKPNFIPVAITESLSEESKTFYKTSYVPYVNNGVSLEPFRNDKNLSSRKYDIVVVGRFVPQKNHFFVVSSFLELKNKLPNIQIALVGGGELLDDVKKFVSDNDAQDFIHFTGILNSPAEIVKDSKVIALGSLYEANPLSLLEGMAAGCIVVSSNVGGVSDIIKEDENGFLFDSGDKEKFVNILYKILSDIDSYQNMSTFNVNYSNQFSMKECARKYYEIFKDNVGK